MESFVGSHIQIDRDITSYEQLRTWREEKINEAIKNHQLLNTFHDELMSKVVMLSIKKLETEQGIVPARFAFIVMGSAGRFEQSIWSDQDHGIIYEGNATHDDYFLSLGAEIVKGLSVCGYEECEGKVMANNPLWCLSSDSWQQQLTEWLEEETWESLRNTSIFFDSRVLIGTQSLMESQKQMIFDTISNKPHLLNRMVDNVQNSKKGIGWFGQLLPIQKGKHKGMLDFKETVLFPFANAMRLLAYQKNMSASPTVDRFKYIVPLDQDYKKYQTTFHKALEFRLLKTDISKSYESIHFIQLTNLTKTEKQEMKSWIKEGDSLMKKVTQNIRQSDRKEDIT
ncbi:DUF294 nucleotidyltransferase-like domain-containing protein [Salipaludibacillus sp. HK11]|uniref:DUF294 nucleotidyltransferase-like domain-containing protein n=1 Tax=Salipaludibacillus sp. HK11 TaxID=3394320 RepID=UPI0039FCBDE7